MKSDEKSLFPIYVAVSLGILTIITGFLWGNVFASLSGALAMIVLGTGFNAPSSTLQLVAAAVSWFLLVLSSSLGETGGSASFLSLLLAGAATSSVASQAFLLGGKEKKTLSVLLGLGGLFLSWLTSFYYVREYLFLYTSRSSYGVIESFLGLGMLTALLSLLFHFFTKERRSPYTVFLSTLSAAFAFVLQGIGWKKGAGSVFLSSPQGWYALMVVALYMYAGRKEQRTYERRMVTFSGMVYEELKPIKKRQKTRKMEIPPNVPVFRRDLIAEMEKPEAEN